jgi:hypothetical protein
MELIHIDMVYSRSNGLQMLSRGQGYVPLQALTNLFISHEQAQPPQTVDLAMGVGHPLHEQEVYRSH